MWVFTKLGFISVVKHAQKKGWLLVRARRRDHLQAILKSAGISLMIKETPDADYRFRVELKPGELENVLIAAIDGIDYTNFKAEVDSGSDHKYGQVLHRIWSAALPLQPVCIRRRGEDKEFDIDIDVGWIDELPG